MSLLLLLTGDNPGSARSVAGALGIDEVHAEVLPGDKAALVGRLRAGGTTVAMVGDGINDAPALAAADVGIAMSTGTDVAMQAAGITLMRGSPALVADALEVSPDAFVNDRFVEVIPNYALTKAHQSTTVFIVSKAKFEALPSDVRSMARSAAREAIKHGLTEHARLNREGLATARAKNVTIVEPELGPFKAAARRSYDTILAEAPEGRAILNEIEAAKR